MRSALARLGAGVALGAVVGLTVALALSLGLSIHHTPGLLGNLVGAGTASTCFLFAARPRTALEAVSHAIFGVVAGGAIQAVGARYLDVAVPRSFMGIEAGLPIAEIPLFYAPMVGVLAGAMVAAIPPRKAH